MSAEPETLGEFIQRIRAGEVDVPPSTGGYLIPEIVRANSPGYVAATYRLLGRLLGNRTLLERGRYDFNVLQALRDHAEDMLRRLD